jgi:hypothetical protein
MQEQGPGVTRTRKAGGRTASIPGRVSPDTVSGRADMTPILVLGSCRSGESYRARSAPGTQIRQAITEPVGFGSIAWVKTDTCGLPIDLPAGTLPLWSIRSRFLQNACGVQSENVEWQKTLCEVEQARRSTLVGRALVDGAGPSRTACPAPPDSNTGFAVMHVSLGHFFSESPLDQ